MTFCVNSADHVAKANRAIVKAADDTDVEPAEEEAGEQLQELPRIDLYTPPKPQCQQQVTTLVAANGPPASTEFLGRPQVDTFREVNAIRE